MANNEDKATSEMLKTPLAKSDALDHKITNMDNNVKAEINEIKVNLEDFKALQKEEVTKIKKTVENVEESQDLINRKFEDQKEKLAQLTKDHTKLFAGFAELRHENNVLMKKNSENSKKINQLGQYMCSSWMLEVSGIPYRKNEDCQQLIEKLVELTNITNFHVAQIDVLHRTSTRENAPIIILFNKKK